MKAKDVLTTVLELLGLLLIVAGVYVGFGLSAALIIGGVLVIGISFLLTTRGGSK